MLQQHKCIPVIPPAIPLPLPTMGIPKQTCGGKSLGKSQGMDSGGNTL